MGFKVYRKTNGEESSTPPGSQDRGLTFFYKPLTSSRSHLYYPFDNNLFFISRLAESDFIKLEIGNLIILAYLFDLKIIDKSNASHYNLFGHYGTSAV